MTRKRNPGKKGLKGATKKQERQYEAIKRSELKRGEKPKTAKRIAAATVRKQAGAKKRKNKAASKGKKALKTTGRALKSAASSVLGAGSKILGAGSKALNPKKRKRATKKRVKRNASRVVRHVSKIHKPRVVRSARKATKRIRVVKARKRATSKAKRNPSAEQIRKTFAGRVTGDRDLYFPQGTPQGLAKLGRLVLIQTEEGTIKPVHGSAWLCADTKGKLHIGSTTNAPLFNGPARNFGKVSKVEYDESKPHLGYPGPIIWFHKLGEESGVKPSLHADGKGGLVFKGGAYRITSRGIEN